MRRLANIPGFSFALFFLWKVLLLLLTAQPVPANDSFFYDGPVVNYLLHGKYCNPSLAEVLPISGREVFSAYPPLHQCALLLWMKCAGTSALAAMWYHVLLLGVFAATVYSTLRALRVPAAALNWAGLFLFAITFHDRPDTLAQVLGALAVWSMVRGWISGFARWSYLAAMFLLLCFATSLQIGGIYLGWLSLLAVGAAVTRRAIFPWWPALAFAIALSGLVALVKFGYPQLWAGFKEHLLVTPSVTGWRGPGVGDVLKIGRAAAGIFLVTGLLAWLWARGRVQWRQWVENPAALVAASGVATAMALITGCLVILTPNTIHIANYLQPVIVGAFLGAMGRGLAGWQPGRPVSVLLAGAVLLVSIRAVGLTTWGVLCAQDVSYTQAMQETRRQVASLGAGKTIAAASAYMYEVARSADRRWVHSDWIGNTRGGRADFGAESLIKLRPDKLMVTQFDYFRRYAQILAELEGHPELVTLSVTNLAHVPVPDASPRLQRVIQHVSWAPVIVNLTWRETQPALQN